MTSAGARATASCRWPATAAMAVKTAKLPKMSGELAGLLDGAH